jgi:hypothetical protein
MDVFALRQHHAPVRVLPHIKKLDDCFGDFVVRVNCPCGASRHIEPEALARIAGKSVTLAALATRMRCSQCGKKVAEVVAVARPRPRGRVAGETPQVGYDEASTLRKAEASNGFPLAVP